MKGLEILDYKGDGYFSPYNFEGWKEKQQIEAAVNSEMTINIELVDDE